MTFVSPKDRVLEQSTSNSQTVFTVTGALDLSYNAFSASMSVGDTTIGAVVEKGVAFKVGLLTYSNTNQVTVTTAYDSKGTFSAGGVKEVFMGLASLPAAVRAVAGVAKKNYLLNSAMMVSQENGATAGTTLGYYLADQWSIEGTSLGTAAFSAAQVASVTPGGSPNRLRLTVTAAQATIGSSFLWLQQKIEGYRVADLAWGTAAAKSLTFQLGVKLPVAGTYTFQVVNAGSTSSASGTLTIAAGEVSTDVVKTVTIAGPTSGTWAKDNTTGIVMQLILMGAGQANVFATNGNVAELFDAGAYEGSIAPPFAVPDFRSELKLCQPYWQKSYEYGVAVGAINANGCESGSAGAAGNLNSIGLNCRFKERMRAAPTTVTVYSETTGAQNKIRDRANSVDVTPSNVDLIGENGFRAIASVTAGTTASVSCHWTANARL